ncbi:hypothetical protein [Pontibacillus salipaludis]|uniref:hypothetical protein n=1 Tax=Pontibacillus salipaludis TaxID=1697394 RepID=UPI0031E78CE0
MEKQFNNHYGIRMLILIITWFAFGGTLLVEDINHKTFTSALILYLLPIAIDYNSHQPKLDKNKRRKAFGIWSAALVSTIFLGISFFGGFNFTSLLTVGIGFFTVKFAFWVISITYVFMAAVDWVEYSSPEEYNHREIIRTSMREKYSNDSVEERSEFYKEISNASVERTGTDK